MQVFSLVQLVCWVYLWQKWWRNGAVNSPWWMLMYAAIGAYFTADISTIVTCVAWVLLAIVSAVLVASQHDQAPG